MLFLAVDFWSSLLFNYNQTAIKFKHGWGSATRNKYSSMSGDQWNHTDHVKQSDENIKEENYC